MKMNLTTSEKNRGIVRFLLMSMLLCLLIIRPKRKTASRLQGV